MKQADRLVGAMRATMNFLAEAIDHHQPSVDLQMNLTERREVGRVVGLWRYPVKSMAAESLSEVAVSWHGLVGDRRWAFIRSGVERSGFPWLARTMRLFQGGAG